MNASSLIVVTEFGIVTLVSPLQPWKALSPISVTESGIVTLVSPLQIESYFPDLVTESELSLICHTCSPLQPSKQLPRFQ